MLRTSLFFALATTAACSFGDDRPLEGPGGDAGPDGGGMDGPMVEEGHLLITEVKSSGNTEEFVEIWNPTNRTIDLRNYYLTDSFDYWKFPSGVNAPTVNISDFLVRFPQGAMMTPGQIITVATEFMAFQNLYDQVATYSLDSTSGPQMMDRLRVPGNPGDASITDNQGELVVLFYWDGVSDLVKDVDIVIAGTGPEGENALAAKQPVDGPDSDTTATPYKPEAMQLGVMAMRALAATSYKRIALEAGSETQTGAGNGITGDDETSEQLARSWDGAAPTTATPGAIPATLR